MADRFSADPTVVFMTSVLDDIGTGKLLIPRFQRPLVWKWDQRRDFLNSIFEGLPIGALMIWVSDGQPIGVYDKLGPHPLPGRASLHGESRYLMDGVQRISTLYGAMRAERTWEEYDATQQVAVQDFQVYADLDAKKDADRFVRKVEIEHGHIERDPSRFLPLNIVLDNREFLRFQRSIDLEREDRLEMSDAVAVAFRTYKVPLIALKSASLEVVTKSFERVNSRGADMSELHMLNALSYSQSFDLLSQDRELRSELLAPVEWQDVDQEVVLRCLKLRLGADIYTTNPDELSDALKLNPSALLEVFSAIATTAALLRAQFDIARPELVPYRMQIVGIADILLRHSLSDVVDSVSDWFWLSTYTEVFGSSARRSENALGDLRSYVESGSFRWSLREAPSVRPLDNLRVDFRAARVKALAFALVKRKNEIIPDEGTADFLRFGRESFTQVVVSKSLRGRAGLRFLISPDDMQAFRLCLLDGTLTDQQRRAHLIGEDAYSAALQGSWELFSQLRERDIYDYERRSVIGPPAQRMGVILPGAEAGAGDELFTVADLFGDT